MPHSDAPQMHAARWVRCIELAFDYLVILLVELLLLFLRDGLGLLQLRERLHLAHHEAISLEGAFIHHGSLFRRPKTLVDAAKQYVQTVQCEQIICLHRTI